MRAGLVPAGIPQILAVAHGGRGDIKDGAVDDNTHIAFLGVAHSSGF